MSICVSCNKNHEGGVYTNGDGFGDAKYVGISTGRYLFYCWDCYNNGEAPDFNKAIDVAFATANMCGFLEAWIGRCRNTNPCSTHISQKCWKCGARAVKNCAEADTLVCGTPECAEHPHQHKEYKS